MRNLYKKFLEERDFPVENLYCLASEKSKGKKLEFKQGEVIVESLDDFDFTKAHIGLFSPGSEVSSKFAPIASSKGCVVIDNTSYFRMHKDIPLIVPEVNGKELENFFKTLIDLTIFKYTDSFKIGISVGVLRDPFGE